jgi:hypothetical protein
MTVEPFAREMELMERALRANVIISSLDTRGLQLRSPAAFFEDSIFPRARFRSFSSAIVG